MSLPLLLVSTVHWRRLLRVSDVQEIVSMMELARVDGQGGHCRGLANLRGELVPVFDPEGPDALLSPSRLIVVLRGRGGPVGLVVDEVHDVLHLPEEQVPFRPVGGERPRQVALLGEELLSVLEPEEVSAHGG